MRRGTTWWEECTCDGDRVDNPTEMVILRYMEYFNDAENTWRETGKVDANELNNFHSKLPGGSQRGVWLEVGGGRTFRESLQNVEGFSELFLSQTPEQFFLDIDQAVSQAGFDVEEVRSLVIAANQVAVLCYEKGYEQKRVEHLQKRDDLSKERKHFLAPVAQILLTQGYRIRDLWT